MFENHLNTFEICKASACPSLVHCSSLAFCSFFSFCPLPRSVFRSFPSTSPFSILTFFFLHFLTFFPFPVYVFPPSYPLPILFHLISFYLLPSSFLSFSTFYSFLPSYPLFHILSFASFLSTFIYSILSFLPIHFSTFYTLFSHAYDSFPKKLSH